MMQGGFAGGQPGAFVMPQTYQRQTGYAYQGGYDRRAPFGIPSGINPNLAALFQQGSQIFRNFNHDFSGTMGHHEFKHAIRATYGQLPEQQIDQLFTVVDVDRAGRLTEREFCEFWVHSHSGGAGAPGGF